MKNFATIGDDGSLTIAPEILQGAGFQPGEQLEVTRSGNNLVLVPKQNWDCLLTKWGGFDKSRSPMTIEEIIVEQRNLRGHDDLD